MHERFLFWRPKWHEICPNPGATCGFSFKLRLLFSTDGAASGGMTWQIHCIQCICTNSGKRRLLSGFVIGSASLALLWCCCSPILSSSSDSSPSRLLASSWSSWHTNSSADTWRIVKGELRQDGRLLAAFFYDALYLQWWSRSTLYIWGRVWLDVQRVCLLCRTHNTSMCSECYQQSSSRWYWSKLIYIYVLGCVIPGSEYSTLIYICQLLMKVERCGSLKSPSIRSNWARSTEIGLGS